MSDLTQVISDNFLKAVDILVDKKISEQNNCKLITAQIIDDSEAYKGVYEVKYETSTFKAYTSDFTLKNNDLVQILLDNNNVSEQKTIVNKVISNNQQEDLILTNSISKYINITNNLIEGKNNSSLIANGINEGNLINNYLNTQDLSLCTKIKFSARFQTTLSENTVEGKYGIRLEITHDDSLLILTFDNKEMLGNSYNYTGYILQQKIFDLSNYNLKNISNISIIFYQEKDSFKDKNGDLIAATDSLQNSLPENLFVKDVELSFGIFQDEIIQGQDSVIISPAKGYSTSYNALLNSALVNLKWLHWNEDNTRILSNKELIENNKYHIKWYKYQLYDDALQTIKLQRKMRRGLFAGINDIDRLNMIEDSLVSELGCPYLDSNNWQCLKDYDDQFQCKIPLNTNSLTEEKILAFVFFDGQDSYFKSNELIFQNENNLKKVGVYLETLDESNGQYYLYAEDGILNNEDKKTRILKVSYYASDGEEINLLENERYSIEWESFPEENTMLSTVSQGNDQTELIYKIEDSYSPLALNNSITCKIIENNDDFSINEYTATITFIFGYANLINAESNLFITFDNKLLSTNNIQYTNNAITIGDTEEIFVLKQFDNIGKEINLNNANITWSLYGFNINTGKLCEQIEEYSLEPIENFNQKIKLKNEMSKFNFNYFLFLRAKLNEEKDGSIIKSSIIDFPIPITIDNINFNYATGPNYIIYKQLGLPVYNKEPFSLYNYNGIEVDKNIYKWKYDNNWDDWYELSEDNTFIPSQVYLETHDAIGVKCENEQTGEIVWLQPINVLQSAFSSQVLNKWDGKSVQIEEGSIVAPMIAAGKKEKNDNDENYSFTGVIMGDLSNEDDFITNTGLYGFKNGISTFGLKDDGTAYFGSKGKGQILIDGEKSIITSSNYESNNKGLFFDLDDGIIKAKNGDYFLEIDVSKKNCDENAELFPLKIGYNNSPNFTVNWNGILTATSAVLKTADVEGKIKATKFEVWIDDKKRTDVTFDGLKIFNDNNKEIAVFSNSGANIKNGEDNNKSIAIFNKDGIFIYDGAEENKNIIKLYKDGLRIGYPDDDNKIQIVLEPNKNGLIFRKGETDSYIFRIQSTGLISGKDGCNNFGGSISFNGSGETGLGIKNLGFNNETTDGQFLIITTQREYNNTNIYHNRFGHSTYLTDINGLEVQIKGTRTYLGSKKEIAITGNSDIDIEGSDIDIEGSNINIKGLTHIPNLVGTSDIRLKDNIKNINYAKNIILNLKPFEYNWIPDINGLNENKIYQENQRLFGVSAQQVISLFKENNLDYNKYSIVDKDSSGIYALNYLSFIPLLIQTIQDLKKEIDELKGEK